MLAPSCWQNRLLHSVVNLKKKKKYEMRLPHQEIDHGVKKNMGKGLEIFVFASVKIRKWFCLFFFMQGELLRDLRKRKKKNWDRLEGYHWWYLKTPWEHPTQPWNSQLCTADALDGTAKGTAQMNCQMSQCSLEWCLLQQTLQKPWFCPLFHIAGCTLGWGQIQELQCWPAWRELTEAIICGSQWTRCPSFFLSRDGKPVQFVLQK